MCFLKKNDDEGDFFVNLIQFRIKNQRLCSAYKMYG